MKASPHLEYSKDSIVTYNWKKDDQSFFKCEDSLAIKDEFSKRRVITNEICSVGYQTCIILWFKRLIEMQNMRCNFSYLGEHKSDRVD